MLVVLDMVRGWSLPLSPEYCSLQGRGFIIFCVVALGHIVHLSFLVPYAAAGVLFRQPRTSSPSVEVGHIGTIR